MRADTDAPFKWRSMCLGWVFLMAVAASGVAARADEPFLGAYIHLSEWFRDKTDEASRERAIIENLDRFRESGLRVLMPFVTTTRGQAYYPSELIPDKVWGSWDPVAVIVREARKRGLKVYPVMCVLACGDKKLAGILKSHPDWALRDKAGEPMGFISSGHPEARKWVVGVLSEIATKYHPDGILLDYCRFPGSEGQMDPVAQAKFEASHPAEQWPRTSATYKEEFRKYKRDCLTELVGQISAALRALRPTPRIAAYMWGAQELKATRDWKTWVGRGYLDMLNLTGYSYREQYGERYLQVLDDRFRDVAAILKELNSPVEFTICVGINTSHGNIRAAREIEDYLAIGKRHGVHGASIFTWETLQTYLPEVKKAGYIQKFAAGLQKPPTPRGAAERPNFIVINIDDLGYADIGPFGSKLNRTPHLDRMASEGRKLACFYAAPVCSPSRTALMTGCYPKRALPIPGVLFPAGAVGVNPEEFTVAELLKEVGYATGCIGKWHLGDQPPFLPTRQGFDYYLGIPYSNDMGPASEGSKSDLGAKLPEPRLTNLTGNDEAGLRGMSQPPLPLLENEKVIARVKQDEQQGIVERYTTAAVKFIRANKDKPFFLYLPHNAVHFPIYPGKKWAGKSPNGIYSDWVEEVDWSVGCVLDTLRELKLAGKTLVIFTSDNGGTARAVNAPLRGNKGSTWEGGMRVPTVAWWPGRIPAGSSTHAVTGMMDVLPTLVKLAGGKLPAGRKLDGGDIWPLLAGQPGAKSPHETFFYYRGLTLEAVRNGPWKLHLGVAAPTKVKGKAKANPKALPQGPQLYNLDDDIGESKNIAAANEEIVKKLRALADAMKDDLGLDGVGPGCRPLGRVSDPKPLIGHDGSVREGFVDGDRKKL